MCQKSMSVAADCFLSTLLSAFLLQSLPHFPLLLIDQALGDEKKILPWFESITLRPDLARNK